MRQENKYKGHSQGEHTMLVITTNNVTQGSRGAGVIGPLLVGPCARSGRKALRFRPNSAQKTSAVGQRSAGQGQSSGSKHEVYVAPNQPYAITHIDRRCEIDSSLR